MNGFSCAVVVGFVNALLRAVIDAQIPLIFCFQAAALSAGDALPLPPPELPEPLLPQPASSAVTAATASRACARFMVRPPDRVQSLPRGQRSGRHDKT